MEMAKISCLGGTSKLRYGHYTLKDGPHEANINAHRRIIFIVTIADNTTPILKVRPRIDDTMRVMYIAILVNTTKGGRIGRTSEIEEH